MSPLILNNKLYFKFTVRGGREGGGEGGGEGGEVRVGGEERGWEGGREGGEGPEQSSGYLRICKCER